MKFRTEVPILRGTTAIDHRSNILLIGSCFAENIAGKFEYYKFGHTANPLGILFSPSAIEQYFTFATGNGTLAEHDLFMHNSLWHCFDAHSEMSGPDPAAVLNSLQNAIQIGYNNLRSASHVIITPGTAWVYRHRDSGKLVANCHKVPQSHFDKELMTVPEVRSSLQSAIDLIRTVNSDCNIIFTISPVRHIKDGFAGNNRSKAHLISAVHEVIGSNVQTEYFPSFEIMTDELRDYRFYSNDMLHPSELAVDYIWSKFAEMYLDKATLSLMAEVASIQKSLAHKPFHAGSDEHRAFTSRVDERISSILPFLPEGSFSGQL